MFIDQQGSLQRGKTILPHVAASYLPSTIPRVRYPSLPCSSSFTQGIPCTIGTLTELQRGFSICSLVAHDSNVPCCRSHISSSIIKRGLQPSKHAFHSFILSIPPQSSSSANIYFMRNARCMLIHGKVHLLYVWWPLASIRVMCFEFWEICGLWS